MQWEIQTHILHMLHMLMLSQIHQQELVALHRPQHTTYLILALP
jgi:hypothetical protein